MAHVFAAAAIILLLDSSRDAPPKQIHYPMAIPEETDIMDFSQYWMECLDGPFAYRQAGSDKKRRNKSEEFCIAMEVVLPDRMALRLLPPRWGRDHKPVVATAVLGCEDALRFASQRLFHDASLIALCQGDHHDEFCDVLRAVEEEHLELGFLAPAWQNNRKPFAFCFASTRLRNDRALAALSIAHSHNLRGLLALPEGLRKDKKLALMVLRVDGMAVALLGSELLPDPDIIATACVKFAAMPYAHHSLQTKEDFVLAIAHKRDPWLIGSHSASTASPVASQNGSPGVSTPLFRLPES